MSKKRLKPSDPSSVKSGPNPVPPLVPTIQLRTGAAVSALQGDLQEAVAHSRKNGGTYSVFVKDPATGASVILEIALLGKG